MYAHQIGLAEPEALFASQFDDGFAFGGLIGRGGEDAEPEKILGAHSIDRIELGGFAIADGDRTGLVQQQRIDVAGGFDGLARLGDDVGLQGAVHTGDADSRQQTADSGRDQADEQRNKRCDGDVGTHVIGERFERGANDHEDDREACEQDGQRNLVRGFLARGTFHEGDHLVKETLARLYGHFYQNTVGKNLRTARDRTLVAARLADHRGRFARDGALVDRRQTFDNLAVGGNGISGDAFEHVALAQCRAADDMRLSVLLDPFGRGLLTGLAQRIGLCLAACFGDGLGEIGEEHRGQQDQEDHDIVAQRTLRRVSCHGDPDNQQQHDERYDLDGEHDRILDHHTRIELAERLNEACVYKLFVEQRIIYSIFHFSNPD